MEWYIRDSYKGLYRCTYKMYIPIQICESYFYVIVDEVKINVWCGKRLYYFKYAHIISQNTNTHIAQADLLG